MLIAPKTTFQGVLTPPGDKSITHRAIMLNAIAPGTAVLSNACLGADCMATAECMRALGATVTFDGATVTVTGAKKLKSGQKLHVANSATTMRLLAGLLCGKGVSATIDGDESIRNRPMSRIIEPLTAMGARISAKNGCAPLKIKSSSLKGIEYSLPMASAQVKSAILLAGIGASGETVVREPAYSRNHTEIMLGNMSGEIRVHGKKITVEKSDLRSCNVRIPGDLSAAAYAIVLATCLPGAEILIKQVGVNPTRRGIIDVINSLGGRISVLKKRTVAGEPVADVLVQSAPIQPFELGGEVIANLIDEIPVLCVLAACAEGKSVIRDAGELRFKESDRIETTVSALKAMGVRAEATEDSIEIYGSGVIMGGGVVETKGDHRIAMSMAVAAALSVKGAEILDAESVDVSYPNFYSEVLGL